MLEHNNVLEKPYLQHWTTGGWSSLREAKTAFKKHLELVVSDGCKTGAILHGRYRGPLDWLVLGHRVASSGIRFFSLRGFVDSKDRKRCEFSLVDDYERDRTFDVTECLTRPVSEPNLGP